MNVFYAILNHKLPIKNSLIDAFQFIIHHSQFIIPQQADGFEHLGVGEVAQHVERS